MKLEITNKEYDLILTSLCSLMRQCDTMRFTGAFDLATQERLRTKAESVAELLRKITDQKDN